MKSKTDISAGYEGIDLLKFICAFLIITMHAAPFTGRMEELNYFVVNWFTRLAVPFFFISTGFFMLGGDIDKERLTSYCGRIVTLYIIWSVIYLPVGMYDASAAQIPPLRALADYLKDLVFSGSYMHLWYLPATVTAVWLACFFIRRFELRGALCVSGALYVLGLFSQTYRGAFPLAAENALFVRILSGLKFHFSTCRNGIFMGFFYVCLGAAAAKWEGKGKKESFFALFLFFFVLSFAEIWLLRRMNWIAETDMAVFTVPASLFLFLYARSLSLKPGASWRRLRRMSTDIYLVHMWVSFAYMSLARLLSLILKNAFLQDYFINWAAASAGSFLLARWMVRHEKSMAVRLLNAAPGNPLSDRINSVFTRLMRWIFRIA